MKKRFTYIFICLICLSVNAQNNLPVKIYGRVDCGEWLSPPSQVQRIANEYWLLGYLTGVNAMLMTPAMNIGNVLGWLNSPKQAFAWMDKYCRENPLSTPDLGGLALMNELKK